MLQSILGIEPIGHVMWILLILGGLGAIIWGFGSAFIDWLKDR